MNKKTRGAALPIFSSVVILMLAATLPAVAQDDVFSTEELCRKNYQTGMEYKKNAKYRDAEEFLMLVVETCPDKLEAYLNLGEIQRYLQNYVDAIDTYDRALEIEPRNLDVKEALAYTYGESGDLDASIDLYQDILDIDPERSGVYGNLAYLYEQQEKWPEAMMMYKNVLAREPENQDVLKKVARMALDKKLYLEAMNLYEKLYEANPDDIGILRILAYFNHQVNLPAQAVELYQQILAMEPESPSALFEMKLLAINLKKAGRPGDAAEVMERIIELEPADLKNYYNIALIYIDEKAYDKAVSASTRGLEQDPSFICLNYTLGKVKEEQGVTADEAESFDRAVDLFKQAKQYYVKCAEGGGFCAGTCQKEIERMDALVDRTQKKKRKKELEE